MLTRLMAFGPVLFLLGCSTFSQKQCREMNWAIQGRSAALAGKTAAERLAYFDRECFQEHGVSPDQNLFQSGYTEGLKEFCTPQYAYRFGVRGGDYNGICPAEKEKEVVESFRSGHIIYLERELQSLQRRVNSLESEVSSLRSELSSCKSRLSSCESQKLSSASCRRTHANR